MNFGRKQLWLVVTACLFACLAMRTEALAYRSYGQDNGSTTIMGSTMGEVDSLTLSADSNVQHTVHCDCEITVNNNGTSGIRLDAYLCLYNNFGGANPTPICAPAKINNVYYPEEINVGAGYAGEVVVSGEWEGLATTGSSNPFYCDAQVTGSGTINAEVNYMSCSREPGTMIASQGAPVVAPWALFPTDRWQQRAVP